MEDKSGIRISQCMIVKNEEKNIERALSWGKEIMWEQIVVDTGSADRTVELAKQMGAKVFFFSWTDDFALAKNYAISKAEGDWIAFLDADEYMMPEDAGQIQRILEDLEEEENAFDGISTGWQQIDQDGKIFSSGTQIRFFRNLPDICYRRRIHEQLESVTGRELLIADVVRDLSIFHTGYQDKEITEKKKNSRNRKLILEELNEHPSDYEMMGYLGDEYFCDEEREKAEEWYRRSIDHMPSKLHDDDQRSSVTFSRLLLILTERENNSWEEIEKVYRRALKRIPEEADFDYIIGRYFASVGIAEKAVVHLETALEKLNTFGCSNKALFLAGKLMDAYELLARCSYETGEYQKCISYGVTCLKYDKYMMTALSRLIKILASDEKMTEYSEQEKNQILDFFAKLYDFSGLKDRLFLLQAAKRSNCLMFSDYVANQLFTLQELALFNKIQ